MSNATHEMRSPTLLIGVGGIGGQIVHTINQSLSDFDRSKIKLLVMDTNVNDLSKFDGSDVSFIQTSKNKTVGGYVKDNPEFLEWFPTHPLINSKNLIQGAGQIRSVSRLGGLASKADGKFGTLNTAIKEMLKIEGDHMTRAVRVMIVGSVTGGTGSGLGIQLPFYIRNVLKNEGVPDALIRGMFLMPSLTEDKQDTAAKKAAVNVNGYAFLKELNAFYNLQLVDESKNNLRIEEYVPGLPGGEIHDGAASSAMIPYNFLFLVERVNAMGNLGGLEEYIERTAQVVLSQLFSPAGTNGLSSEDNMIVSSIPANGMNRYCGAGVANAIYPKDSIMRYCTVKYAQQLLGGYWLAVDRQFKLVDTQNRNLKKTNPSIANLDKGKTFRKLFDDMCDPKKHDIISELIGISHDLNYTYTVKHGDESEEKTARRDVLIAENIEKYLDNSFTQEKLQNNETLYPTMQKCKMTVHPTDSLDDVTDNINTTIRNIASFETAVNDAVTRLSSATIESIMPSELETAKSYPKGSLFNIYSILKECHPIAARYLIYGLLEKLNDLKATADSKLNGAVHLKSLHEIDFYPEGRGDTVYETPVEALNRIGTGWLSFINIYSDAYKSKVGAIIKAVSAETERIKDIALNSYKSTVYATVIKRLEMLIKIYEEFFEELISIRRDKEEEAETLELGIGESVNRTSSGDMYICDAPIYRKRLYKEFEDSISGEDLEMTPELKSIFFDDMFGIYAVDLKKAADPDSNITRKSYRTLFEDSIIAPITEQFKDSGYKHLDMSIIDAIYKQYTLSTPDFKDRKSAEFERYFNDICATVKVLAHPYLSFQIDHNNPDRKDNNEDKNDNQISYAWGVNSKAVSCHQSADENAPVDKTALKNLIGNDESYRDFVADDSYDPTKLVCYSTLYDLFICDCSAYVNGTSPEKSYSERLKTYANKENYVSNNDDGSYINVVHPHLDKRWHEHAYIPELMYYDEEAMCNKINLAFMLSVMLDRCIYSTDKIQHLSCWWYKYATKNSMGPIFVDGKELTAKSYLGLYKAFDRNRVIVNDIITYADKLRIDAYNAGSFEGITAEDVLKQPIIEALYFDEDIGENGGSVLDLIFMLYKTSNNFSIVSAMLKALRDYLYKYAWYMMNNSEHPTEYLYKQLLLKIGESSACLKDTEGTPVRFLSEVADFIKADAEE